VILLAMDLTTFKKTLHGEKPSAQWSILLQALWYDGKGDWHRAHDIADGHPAEGAKWVHAYLHRKDGDEWNAQYWYRQAGRTFPINSLEEEWEELVKWFLEKEDV